MSEEAVACGSKTKFKRTSQCEATVPAVLPQA